jgi:predicted nuclease of predicted toxin-antitoxin system
MRLLIDANLSPRVARGLNDAGLDATHVADVDLLTADDEQIFDHAISHGFVIVTADSDFGMLLALRRAASPSVVHLRHVAELPPDDHIALLVANLPAIESDLGRRAIASLSPTRLALRDLPLR